MIRLRLSEFQTLVCAHFAWNLQVFSIPLGMLSGLQAFDGLRFFNSLATPLVSMDSSSSVSNIFKNLLDNENAMSHFVTLFFLLLLVLVALYDFD